MPWPGEIYAVKEPKKLKFLKRKHSKFIVLESVRIKDNEVNWALHLVTICEFFKGDVLVEKPFKLVNPTGEYSRKKYKLFWDTGDRVSVMEGGPKLTVKMLGHVSRLSRGYQSPF